MDNNRINDLASDLWNHVFGIMDQEIDLTGDDAGKIAQATKEAFIAAVNKTIDENCGVSSEPTDKPSRDEQIMGMSWIELAS